MKIQNILAKCVHWRPVTDVILLIVSKTYLKSSHAALLRPPKTKDEKWKRSGIIVAAKKSCKLLHYFQVVYGFTNVNYALPLQNIRAGESAGEVQCN